MNMTVSPINLEALGIAMVIRSPPVARSGFWDTARLQAQIQHRQNAVWTWPRHASARSRPRYEPEPEKKSPLSAEGESARGDGKEVSFGTSTCSPSLRPEGLHS